MINSFPPCTESPPPFRALHVLRSCRYPNPLLMSRSSARRIASAITRFAQLTTQHYETREWRERNRPLPGDCDLALCAPRSTFRQSDGPHLEGDLACHFAPFASFV